MSEEVIIEEPTAPGVDHNADAAQPAPPDPAPAPDAPPPVPSTFTPPDAEKVEAESNPWDFAPENWREVLAGGDEKKLNRLARFSSMKDFNESYWNAQDKIAKGRGPELPPNPTAEDVHKFREELGLPAKYEDFKIELPEGMQVSQDDPMLEGFRAWAYNNNLKPEQAKELAQYYAAGAMQEQQHRYQMDNQERAAAEKVLKESWGADMQSNLNLIAMEMNKMPDEFKTALASARLGDGRALFNSPEFLNWFVGNIREANPAAAIMPSGENSLAGMKTEIERLERVMHDDPAKYWADEGMQKRLRDLYDARSKMER